MKLDKQNPVTLQQQLYQDLSDKIKNGQYKPGDRIPTEQELSESYGVSRITVRAAIQQLSDQKMVIKKPGKGTFVQSDIYTELVYPKGGSFTENCLRHNAVPSTRIIERVIRHDSSNLTDPLKDADGNVLTITRVRSVNSVPCIVEIDFFPPDYLFLLSTDTENVSFLKLIARQTGLIPDEYTDAFTIEYANKTYARELGCSVHTPLLKVTQTVRTADKKIIYINIQYILTSKYIYVKS